MCVCLRTWRHPGSYWSLQPPGEHHLRNHGVSHETQNTNDDDMLSSLYTLPETQQRAITDSPLAPPGGQAGGYLCCPSPSLGRRPRQLQRRSNQQRLLLPGRSFHLLPSLRLSLPLRHCSGPNTDRCYALCWRELPKSCGGSPGWTAT